MVAMATVKATLMSFSGLICPPRVNLVLSGMGLLTDTYDLQVINLARHYIALERDMSSSDEAMVTSAAITGSIFGMLVFGSLADRLGRRAVFISTALLTTIGAFGSALASPQLPCGLYTQLAFWRFVMGTGIGGEYPLSASTTAEHAEKHGGMQLALTFSMMGWGGLLAPLVFSATEVAGLSNSLKWRVAFTFGGLLSLVGVVLRAFFLYDSERFLTAREVAKEQAEEQRAKNGGTGTAARRGLGGIASPMAATVTVLRIYWRPLLGTASCWLLFDIYEYGLNLYTSDIAEDVFGSSGDLAPVTVVLLLRLLTIPGYLAGVLNVELLGRRETMSVGFVAMGACLGLIGSHWRTFDEHKGIFMAVFGLSQVLNYSGAAVATFVIPGEIFPSTIRATCHGLSAASGKVGAVLGSVAFPLVVEAWGLPAVFFCCAFVCALGLLASEACIPSYDDEVATDLDRAHRRGEYLERLYGGRDSACVRIVPSPIARGKIACAAAFTATFLVGVFVGTATGEGRA